MACPYLHNANNGTEAPLEAATTIGETEVDEPAEPLNYTHYLGIHTLLSALNRLSHIDPSDVTSPPVHDEHFFIIVHQGTSDRVERIPLSSTFL